MLWGKSSQCLSLKGKNQIKSNPLCPQTINVGCELNNHSLQWVTLLPKWKHSKRIKIDKVYKNISYNDTRDFLSFHNQSLPHSSFSVGLMCFAFSLFINVTEGGSFGTMLYVWPTTSFKKQLVNNSKKKSNRKCCTGYTGFRSYLPSDERTTSSTI